MAIARTTVLNLEGCTVFKRMYFKAGDVSSRKGGKSPMFGFLLQGSIQITSDDLLMPNGNTFVDLISTPGFIAKPDFDDSAGAFLKLRQDVYRNYFRRPELRDTILEGLKSKATFLRTALEDDTIMVAVSPTNDLRPYEKRIFHIAAGEEITLNRRTLAMFYVAKGTVTVLGFDKPIEASVDTAKKIPPAQNTIFKADEDTMLVYVWQK